jgi:4-aminobutyrate aminotransferase-like enzyme
VRGDGSSVWDTEGRRYLDFIGGYSSCILGHNHPRLVSAATDQLRQLTLAHSANSLQRDAFEEKLCRLMMPFIPPSKVWLTTGGARAVELAWKIAAVHRPGFVLRFDLAYHGRSLATAMLSDTARSSAVAFDTPKSLTIPFPAIPSDPRFADSQCQLEAACAETLEQAEQLLAKHHRHLSMLLMEPAIGSRGYYFAPSWFCKRLADLAHGYGLLVASDEIQMGLGRMGDWSVARADAWQPDLIILGKALGGGVVSIGAVVGSASLLDALPEGIESETYAAMPLACRIGLEVLDTLDQEGWVHSARDRGDRWRDKLRTTLPESIRVAGRGLATVLQFADRNGWDGWGAISAKEWAIDLSRSGLLLHLTGPSRNRLAIIPPLNASDEAMAEALDALARKAASC